jgi:hypothetical protein
MDLVRWALPNSEIGKDLPEGELVVGFDSWFASAASFLRLPFGFVPGRRLFAGIHRSGLGKARSQFQNSAAGSTLSILLAVLLHGNSPITLFRCCGG